MYEQLKAVPDRTPLQERLVLLVHLKKKQIKMREVELYALGAMTEENSKQLKSLVESYRRMVFPGVKEEDPVTDSQLQEAKQQFASEMDKVFLVRPLEPGEELPTGSVGNVDLARLHSRQISEEERRKLDESRRLRNRGRKR